MNLCHAILLSVMGGVTELLPVSWAGHMIVTSQLLQIPQTDFLKTFEISIQLGCVAALVTSYWRTFLLDWEIDARVLVAFLPTAILGFLFYRVIDKTFLENAWVVVWSWFIGGAFIILLERFYPVKDGIKELKKITYAQAFVIGTCQALGIIPGVSRLAASIMGGLILGIDRRTIVDFSLVLAVPTMLTTSILDIIKADADISNDQWGLLALGFLTSFIVAWGTIKFLLKYVKCHHFTVFGLYRVVAALITGFFLNLLLS